MVGKTRASLSPPRWLALGRCDFQSRPALCMEHAVKAAVVGRALRASRAAGTPPHPKSEVGSPKSAPAEQPFQRKERGGFDAKERKEQPGNGREAGGARGRSSAAKLGLQGFAAWRVVLLHRWGRAKRKPDICGAGGEGTKRRKDEPTKRKDDGRTGRRAGGLGGCGILPRFCARGGRKGSGRAGGGGVRGACKRDGRGGGICGAVPCLGCRADSPRRGPGPRTGHRRR